MDNYGNSRRKTIMMLGAGNSQLPAIRQAVASGFFVITVDNIPGNAGHALSHRYVNCSTVDMQGVLRAAQELAIDGIMTFASDVATPAVGYVAEQMGLPGCPYAAALVMSDKSRFRAFQAEHGLPHPKFTVGRNVEDMRAWLVEQQAPLVFKPVDSSGSRGVSIVSSPDLAQCQPAAEYAAKYSRSGLICAEEFLEGTDVSGDGFLVNGALSVAITNKYKSKLVPRGHRLPSALPERDQDAVKRAVAEHCRALNYRNGPLDFDVRVRDGKAVVLEMSPRLGGNGIPLLIKRGGGVDLIGATVRFAAGDAPDIPTDIKITRGCGSWILGSTHAGRLLSIASADAIKQAVPEIFDYTVYRKFGDSVAAMEHSAAGLGWALFDCDSDAQYLRIVERIQQSLDLSIG